MLKKRAAAVLDMSHVVLTTVGDFSEHAAELIIWVHGHDHRTPVRIAETPKECMHPVARSPLVGHAHGAELKKAPI